MVTSNFSKLIILSSIVIGMMVYPLIIANQALFKYFYGVLKSCGYALTILIVNLYASMTFMPMMMNH